MVKVNLKFKKKIKTYLIKENNMPKIPPHFIVEKDNKVFFLIKGVFPEHLILKDYMPYFPKTFKGIVI